MIGQTISHYRILQKIGEGGMGAVYKAEDIKLKRTVALKLLPQDLTRRESAKHRFVREAQVAASLEHPNVCTIHEIDETEDGQMYICMAYCMGESLGSRLKRKRLELPDVIATAIGISRGLAEAHRHGIIHRDIKPSNIMITEDDEVKILDFGIAKQVGAASLTSTGMAVGTPAYMSPEQAAGMKIDHRVDIWALGVVLYEMVTGNLPFTAETVPDLLQAICAKEAETIPHLPNSGFAEISAVIRKCLAKKPDQRYQSVPELLQDLEAVQAVASGKFLEGDSPASSERTSRKGPLLAVVSIAAVVLVVLAVVLWFQKTRLGDLPGQLAAGDVPILAVLDFENLEDSEDAQRLGQILQELVITDLSDISSLNVLSSQRLLGVQKQLGYTGSTRINREIAGAVSRHAGASRMLSGSIIQLGETWILTSQLIDVVSGTVIKSQRIDGSDIYAMVDELSSKLREDLDLPLGSADYVDVAVRDKTSASMEAYRHYLTGVERLNASALTSSIAEFQRAVDIDPTFNQAYYKMALAQWWSDDVTARHGRESIARILENERYTSDRDRRLAEGALALIDRRFTDAVAIYEDMVEEYPDDKEVYYVLGLAYHHESSNINHDKAIAAFEKAIELDPTFVLPYRGIYDVYMATRDFVKAAELANNLIIIKPDSPMGYRYLVEAALCKGDSLQFNLALRQALRHHETPEELRGLYYHMGLACNRIQDEPKSELYTRKALEIDPETADYRIFAQLGDALFNQGKIDEAKDAYQRGLELNPLSSWCLGGLWYVAIHNREYDLAIDYASELVELRPQEPRRHAELITSFVESRRYAEAESVLTAGLGAIPSTSGKLDLLQSAAEIYRLDDKHDEAEELLLRAEKLDPSGEAATVYALLATMNNEKREYERARHYARKALASDPSEPTDALALHELFHSYLYSGQMSEALEVAHRRIDRRPHLAISYSDLAEAYITLGRYAQADSLLQAAMDVDSLRTPRHHLYSAWGTSYRRAGQLQKAEGLYRRACDVRPSDKWMHHSLGFVCELEGEHDEARQCYEVALRIEPGDVRALQSLGRLYSRQGLTTEAEKAYRRALEIDSGDARTLRELSLLLGRTGRNGEAIDHAEEALDRDPSFFSYVTLAWVLVEGDSDIERGIDLAQEALDNPPPDDPTDEYVKTHPSVPLPEHVLGLAHLKQGDSREALPLLKRAAVLRPDDDRIAKDLASAQERVRD